MNQEVWIITADETGRRIDKHLANMRADWSRTLLQAWIKDGRVLVNGKTVKSNYALQKDDEITVYPEKSKEKEIVPENIPLNICFEDDDILVVNKPRGMVVHPAPGHDSGTLVHALLYHVKDLSSLNGEERPGIVHRLDKDTSGLLIVAKKDDAHENLNEQLQERRLKRVYRAIVHGVIPHEYGTIEAPIGRDPKDRQKMAVTAEHAKEAVTHFNVLEQWEDYTYVECQLETGRTHQIRVHMAYIGHPVAGDPKYGPTKMLSIKGQALHAAELGFIHPRTGREMTINAEIPTDMKQLLDELQQKP
ncbi:RluA family pseudouridine synthase [Bacillus piscicola]|uniref:RluA family pseudouridine synthase n=1 Tax=Bacillus piscicola TaxID=1632684 RepID=UPI001F09F480|nr:RluA family pseudouridine synthase [Bacillus piscicola]